MGKDWAGPFFPPSLIFRSSIDRFVFRFIHSILTFVKDLYQSENQVFNPTRLLVLLHCWMGIDWAGPFFPSSKMYWSIYLSFSLLNYAALSLHLNTNVWPVPKRESSFQTNKFNDTSALLGGERLGRPNLSPLQNVPIFLFIFSVCWIMQSLNVSERFWTTYSKRELSFLIYKFIGTSTLWGGERLGRPILSPPPPPINVSIFLFIV